MRNERGFYFIYCVKVYNGNTIRLLQRLAFDFKPIQVLPNKNTNYCSN